MTTLPRTHYLGVDVSKGLTISHMASHPNNAQYPDASSVSYDEQNARVTVVYNDHSLYIWDVKDIRKVIINISQEEASVGATAELLVFIPWKAKEVQKEPQYVTRDYESARNAIVIYNLQHSQHEVKQIGMIKLFCPLQSLQIFVTLLFCMHYCGTSR